MKLLSIEDLRMLAGHHPPPCISITLATGTEADRATYRRLLAEVEPRLDVPRPLREKLLEPLRDLDTEAFWSVQNRGLAVFRSQDVAVYYRLPVALPTAAHVDRRFHTTALLPSLRAGTRYLLLTLAQHEVALYQGNLVELHRVHVAGLPSSMAEALGPEWRQRLLGAHSQGHGPLVFHGHGEPSADAKTDVLRFFRVVDEGLWPYLRESDLPLILAGVEHYHALFRQASRYQHVLRDGITGNVEHLSRRQLLERALPIAERLADASVGQAMAEYARHRDHGRATDDLRQIARAAVRGQVRRLILREGAAVRGSIDLDTGALRTDGAEDALEQLAEQVLLRGGDLLAAPGDRMPEAVDVVATLRW